MREVERRSLKIVAAYQNSDFNISRSWPRITRWEGSFQALSRSWALARFTDLQLRRSTGFTVSTVATFSENGRFFGHRKRSFLLQPRRVAKATKFGAQQKLLMLLNGGLPTDLLKWGTWRVHGSHCYKREL